MKYSIIYDNHSRLRIRYGKNAFNKEESYHIAEYFSRYDFIITIKACYANGSILFEYEDGFRDKLIAAINDFKISKLKEIKEANPVIQADARKYFANKIIKLVVKKFIYSTIVPVPFKGIFTFVKSIDFIKAGLKALLSGKINVEVLDFSAICAALYQKDYDTANSIMFLLNVSEVIEEYTRDKAKNSLTANLALNVDKVWLVNDDEEINVPIAQVSVGDKVRIRSGSVIPVDGTVIDGEASVNEATMTGESLAVLKSQGSTVFAGTVVEEGSIVVEITALENDSRLSKIIKLIDESESFKADVHSKALKMADKIVPFSFLTAIGVYAFTRNLTKALSVLMVDFSCAIKLSTPICIASAMSEAARHSVVVKGGKFLEKIAKADMIVFDKTGTLTLAVPSVKKVYAMNGFDEEYVLKTSACLEEHFPHSVARAIVKKSDEMGYIHTEEHAEVEYIVAHGIASKINNCKVIIGSSHFVFEDEGIEIDEEQRKFIDEHVEYYSAVYLAVGGKLAGFILIDDPIRKETKRVLTKLKEAGMKVCMLTGDSENAAKRVCNELGIKNYCAGILPEDKSGIVELYKKDGYTVVMVGDGVNDTPALAMADVSISLKDSSDIAREVSDITIMSDSLDAILDLREIGCGMIKKINRNYRYIVGINSSLLVLGILGVISPATSAIIHNMSTAVISLSSMKNNI